VTIELTNSADTPEHAELRRTVRTLCEQFGEKYWQQRDLNREYSDEFVETLTKADHLSALIPGGCGDEGTQRANVDAFSGADR
jgi:acyl-CoA dehydrogenase